MIDAIVQVASLYDVHWNGTSIRTLSALGWETKVVFDDSILQDRQTNINEGILLANNGLMSKKRFLMEKLGYTEESGISADVFDFAQAGAQEGMDPNAEPEAQEERESEAEDES